MYITKEDLKLLLEVEKYLWNIGNTSLYLELFNLNERLLNERDTNNAKVKQRMYEKRKINKMYGRSKKEIMAHSNAIKKRKEV